ncbi:uncharacterized protein LOC115627398 [Scaptodrosophila lebanonensis]|uniref:Uncharacterized protein LOC115627398 n=1 Tax=Drosophila lebanonensis TaxID=7225 RepID=A0A6J2TUT2_DROLE|nr:uncharacterized protein LOC115627398 [Scaptodrosophila lebanonensis]
MNGFLGLVMLLSAVAASEKPPMPTMATLTTTTTARTTVKAKDDVSNMDKRDKRQLRSSNGYPIFFDGVNPGVQPISVVTPVASNANAQVGGQQPSFLPNFGFGSQQQQQPLPIIGTLVGNLPGLQGGLPNLLNGLGPLAGLGGLGSLGGLNLGNLGILGNLGNLGGNGGQPILPPVLGSNGNSNPAASCPITQRLTCRCEPLLSLQPLQGLSLQQPPKALGSTRQQQQQQLHITKQNVRRNADGSRELRLVLSNGLIIYQHSGKERASGQQGQQGQQDVNVNQGYYTLRLADGRYFTIFYTINDFDYTVKADVSNAPPKSDFDDELNGLL